MKLRVSSCLIICLVCLSFVGCEMQNNALFMKYNQLCREEYSLESYNTAFKAVTKNKNTGKIATYVREVDKKGNIHITVSNNDYNGEVYYIGKDSDCYLKQQDSDFIKVEDLDPSLVYAIPLVGNYTLDSLGFKSTDTVDMKVEDTNYRFSVTSDELNEGYLIVDGQSDKVKQVHIDNDTEIFNIVFYEPNDIHMTESDDESIKEVDEDTFVAALTHLKLNGAIADGVYSMDNAKVFSIDATIASPDETVSENNNK